MCVRLGTYELFGLGVFWYKFNTEVILFSGCVFILSMERLPFILALFCVVLYIW